MVGSIIVWSCALLVSPLAEAVLHDTFTFGDTDWKNHVYGPKHWDKVECDNVEDCVRSFIFISNISKSLNRH